MDEEDCTHQHVERDDDGLSGRWFTCTDCNETVVLTEPDEDGESFWEVVSSTDAVTDEEES